MAHLDIHQFICRSDNYGILIHDHDSGTTISVDAPDATAIADNLMKRGWQLTHILTTHHHEDHVEGNRELKDAYGCTIIGPELEKDKIPVKGQTLAIHGWVYGLDTGLIKDLDISFSSHNDIRNNSVYKLDFE